MLADLTPLIAELAKVASQSTEQLAGIDERLRRTDTQEIIDAMQPADGIPITTAIAAAQEALTALQTNLAIIGGGVRRRFAAIAASSTSDPTVN